MGKKIQCIGRYTMDAVTLGKGNFAHVELATHTITEVKVAIKIIDTRKIKEEYVRANLHREARIMASLRHPNIIRLYETLKATTLYCLVTEYASGGELLAYIKSQKDCKLGESASRPFIRQLLSAIHYLHERGVVHRDLKMENIMLNEKQKCIKLIDFGLSNIYKDDELLKTHCGSPEYAAPELFDGSKAYGPEIDIWSFGIIMYAMVLGRLPFCTPFKDEYHRQRMLQQIHKGLSPVHDREMQPLSADCRNLLHQLIEPNAQLRIPLPEIMCHPWVTKNGKCPFVPYTPPPKNKMLRNQIVSALAIMMDMKKGVVNETVKENRADELSAMFNMMMDNRKRIMGLCEYDHTRPPRSRSSRSRSGDREKSQTPESSCRTAIRHQGPGAGRKTLTVTGPGTGKKAGAGSKVKPKNRPLAKTSTTNCATTPKVSTAGSTTLAVTQHPTAGSSTALPTSQSSAAVSTDTSRLSAGASSTTQPHSIGVATGVIQSLAAAGIHPGVRMQTRRYGGPTLAGSVAAALGALGGLPAAAAAAAAAGVIPPAANGPTRIPLSQRRDPPPKLSMTLDLSVTNPRLTSKNGAERSGGTGGSGGGATPTTVVRRRDAVIPDSSFGIAASSGVPPRMSPKENNKDISRIPVPNNGGTASGVKLNTDNTSPLTVGSTPNPSSSIGSGARGPLAGGLSRARRPSSLQYCIKSTTPRLAPPPATPPEDEDSESTAAAVDKKPSRQQLPSAVAVTPAVPIADRPSARRSAGWPGAVAVSSRIVAPKATPEDSIIDSCSTADDDEDDGLEYRLLGSTFADATDHDGGRLTECRVVSESTTKVAKTGSSSDHHLKAGAADIDLLNFDRSTSSSSSSAKLVVSSDVLRRQTNSFDDFGDDFDEFDDDIDDEDNDYESVRHDAELCREEVPCVTVRHQRLHNQHYRSVRASRSASPDPFRLADILAARAVLAVGGGSCDPAGFPLRRHHWTVTDHPDGTEAIGSGTSLPGCLPLSVGASCVSSFVDDETAASGATTMSLPSALPRSAFVLRPVDFADGSSDTETTLTPAASNHSSLSAASSSTLTLSRKPRQRRSPPNLSLSGIVDRRLADNDGCRDLNGAGIGGSAGRLVVVSSDPSIGVTTVSGAGESSDCSSQSYDNNRARFSHLGAHALDVFNSPGGNGDADSEVDEHVDSANSAQLSSSPLVLTTSPSLAGSIHATDGTSWRPVVDGQPSTISRPSSSLSLTSATRQAFINHAPASSSPVAAPIAPVVGLIEGFSDIDEDGISVDDVILDEKNAKAVRTAHINNSDRLRHNSNSNNVNCRYHPSNSVVSSSTIAASFASTSSCEAVAKSVCSSSSSSSSTGTGVRSVSITGTIEVGPSLTRRVSADESPGFDCRRSSAAGAGGGECSSSLAKDNGLSATWLVLPEMTCASVHRDGHSPCTSIVWPAETLRSRTKTTSSPPVSSSSSAVSISQIGDVESSPEKHGTHSSVALTAVTPSSNQVTASSTGISSAIITTMSSTAVTIRDGNTEQWDLRTSKTKPNSSPSMTTATTQTSDLSRIPRLTSSIRRRLPVFGSLLDRKGSSGDVDVVVQTQSSSPVRKEDKRVLKSSHAAVGDSTVAARLLSSSWRQGLTHWLQMSRASSSASTTSCSLSSTNNNVVDGPPSPSHQRRSSSAKRRRQQASKNNSTTPGGLVKSSAPMTISLVSNHGLVRTATGVVLPNSIVMHRKTSSAMNDDDVAIDGDVISDADSAAVVAQIVMSSSTPSRQYGSSGSDIVLLSKVQPDAVHHISTLHHQHNQTQPPLQPPLSSSLSSSSSNKLSAVQSQVRSLLDVIDGAQGTTPSPPSSHASKPTTVSSMNVPHCGLPGGSPAAVALRQPLPPTRSQLGRLRARKVQWQECEKCARSDHSSDESADSAVLSPLTGIGNAGQHVTSGTAAMINAASHRLLTAAAPDNNGRSVAPVSPQPIVANNISSNRSHNRHT